jgi:hypothetical protein
LIRKPFRCPTADVDRGELAALYTLQHCLPRHAQAQPRFEHRQIAGRCVFDEARPQFIDHADAPGGAGGQLFTDDDPSGEPAMQRGRRHAEDLGGLRDRQQLAVRAWDSGLAPGNVAVAAQAPDVERCEALPAGRAFALAIEDAGDDGVGVVRGETENEREAVLVGLDTGRIRAGQADLKFGDGAPAPAQREASAAIVAIDRDHHIVQERTQQFFLVAVRGGGGRPDASKIIAERAEALGIGRAEDLPPLVLADGKLTLGVLEIPQTLLPLRFQAAGDEAILRLHGAIAPLSAFGFIPRTLDGQTPLRERRVVVGFELLRRHQGRLHSRRGEGCQKGRRHRVVDLDTADVEAVDAAAVDQIFARAVVARRGMATAIVGVEAAPPVPARGEPLEQGGALSHGASWLVRLGVDVAVDARLIGFVRGPVDEALMVVGEEDRPFSPRQAADSLTDGSVRIDVPLAAASAIDIGASHRPDW